MDNGKREGDEKEPDRAATKLPYATPTVVDYGSVTELTAGSRSKQSDAPAAGFKK